MYRRKVICSTHNGPSRHPVTNEILYVLATNRVISQTLPRRQECWDCGEKRRDEEEKKKQDRLTKTFQEEEEIR